MRRVEPHGRAGDRRRARPPHSISPAPAL